MKSNKLSTDQYDELAIQLRKKIAKEFLSSLEDTGIDEDDKKELCSEFMAEVFQYFDRPSMIHQDTEIRPVIGFLKSSKAMNVSIDDTLLPYDAYQHHEHIWEESDEY